MLSRTRSHQAAAPALDAPADYARAASIKAATALAASATAWQTTRSGIFASRAAIAGSGSTAINRQLRIERRRPAEPQGEIERLAEEHDEVRLAKNLRVAAERGIVDAARTFHRDHRRTYRVLQRGDEGAAAPRAQRRQVQ